MHIFVTSFDKMSLIWTLLYTEVLKYQYMVVRACWVIRKRWQGSQKFVWKLKVNQFFLIEYIRHFLFANL